MLRHKRGYTQGSMGVSYKRESPADFLGHCINVDAYGTSNADNQFWMA